MSIEWRPIPGWPEYLASDTGDIRRVGSLVPLQPATAGHSGYLSVQLWRFNRGKRFFVHRLVCATFNGLPPDHGMDCAHNNGEKADNRPSNLRWATRTENERDKRRHRRDNAGSRNGMATLTEQQVQIARSRVHALPRSSGGKRIKKGALDGLALELGVSPSCLRNIAAGRSWKHV